MVSGDTQSRYNYKGTQAMTLNVRVVVTFGKWGEL